MKVNTTVPSSGFDLQAVWMHEATIRTPNYRAAHLQPVPSVSPSRSQGEHNSTSASNSTVSLFPSILTNSAWSPFPAYIFGSLISISNYNAGLCNANATLALCKNLFCLCAAIQARRGHHHMIGVFAMKDWMDFLSSKPSSHDGMQLYC